MQLLNPIDNEARIIKWKRRMKTPRTGAFFRVFIHGDNLVFQIKSPLMEKGVSKGDQGKGITVYSQKNQLSVN